MKLNAHLLNFNSFGAYSHNYNASLFFQNDLVDIKKIWRKYVLRYI